MVYKKVDIYQKEGIVYPPPSSPVEKELFLHKYLYTKIQKTFSCAPSRIKKIDTGFDGGITLSISARNGFTINNVEDVVMGLFGKKFTIEQGINNDKNNKKFTIKGGVDEVIKHIMEHEQSFVTDVMQRRGRREVAAL